MGRICPSCKSHNARRSTVRTSDLTLRHTFLSPYRCRDCRKRFWVLSRNSYYLAGVLTVSLGISILIWNWDEMFEFSLPVPSSAQPPMTRLAEVTKRANDNDPMAEYELARMYAGGVEVVQNVQSEMKMLERAAQHGNVQAQYEYGIALRDGHGSVQNYDAARKWIQRAAEAGHAAAQFALGGMYRQGQGSPADNVKAYIWYNVAAAQDARGAAAARDAVGPRLSPTELLDAQAEALRLSAANPPKAAPAQ